MSNKIVKIAIIAFSFFFLTGFIPVMSILGPGITAVTSGNIYKASAQFIIDQGIKKKTGKNSLSLVKHEIDKKNQQNTESFNEDTIKKISKSINLIQQGLNLIKKNIN